MFNLGHKLLYFSKVIFILFFAFLNFASSDQYFLANLEDQELSRLQPEFPTTSDWKFKQEGDSFVWENCDVGNGGGGTGSDSSSSSASQDWILTDWLTSVSHENLKLFLKISYVFWCDKPGDSSCVNEPLRITLTSDEDKQRSDFNVTLRDHHYFNPSSQSPPTYRVQMQQLPNTPKTSKFKLGMSAGSFCVKVASVQLIHPICPETTKNLARFPVTFVTNTSPGSMQTVFGQCVLNAGLPVGMKYASSQDCSSAGVWMNDAPACQCLAGFEPTVDMEACTACKPGQFKSGLSNRQCTSCPTNSDSRSTGADKCSCSSGYYRNPDESPSLSCGSTPSKPRNLKVSATGMDGQTTKLIWSAPLDFGHRSKVNYKIVCVIGCVQQEPFVTNYTQIAIPVEPDTLYKFRVYSQNSLSGFYPFEALRFDETEFRTAKSYVVRGIGVSEITSSEIKLEWERPRGYPGNRYCIRISRRHFPNTFALSPASPSSSSKGEETRGMKYDVSCTNHSSQHPEIILSHLQPGTYQFSVRTQVDGVAGPFSEAVGIEIQESAVQMGMRHVGLVVGIMLTVCMLFIILCVGMALLYKRRSTMAAMKSNSHGHGHGPPYGYKYEQATVVNHPHHHMGSAHHPHFDMGNGTLGGVGTLGGHHQQQQQKMPVGHQLFTEPSFFEDTDQVLAELTCELDEKFVQLSSEGTPQEQGAVFRGTLLNPGTRDYTRVAVKALYLNMATPESGRKFALEAALMSQFQHVNVCAFYGVVYSNAMWMGVSELCERGPLYRVLQEGHSTHSLSLPTQLLLVKGIAQGMHYLSELGYVHKVLTSGNVIITEREVPKICGFDMRALLDESNANTKTFQELSEYLAPWQAPEVMTVNSNRSTCSSPTSAQGGGGGGSVKSGGGGAVSTGAGGVGGGSIGVGIGGGKYSCASDVWSFAVVTWEVMSKGQEPYGQMNAQQICEFVTSGKRLSPSSNCPTALSKLMNDCWNENRALRPWFGQVNESISALVRVHCVTNEFQFPQPTLYGKLVDQPNDYYMTLQKVSLAGLEPPQSTSPTGTDNSGAPIKPAQPITVREWLKEISMTQYSEKLEQSGYMELKDLFDLQDASLKSIGVSSAKNRKKLLANIALAKIKERKQTNYGKANQLNSIL